MSSPARMAAGLRWYVRELLGETKYERYLERMERHHPEAARLTKREFWREHSRAAERADNARCC